MSKASKAGLIVLLAKLGPKLFPLFAKLGDALWGVAKSLFGVKAVGVVGSVGLYTYLFTWQMGLALVVFIAIHEYGHLWAMKRCGIKTRGMFFIPGFGAVAVAEERFGSARNEAYIALMGPVFGLIFFVVPMLVAYRMTGDALWVAVASFTAFINMVNLFPINPLDGGRLLKAVAYSTNHVNALVITATVSLVATIFGVMAGFWLLIYMALIGLGELALEFGLYNQLKSFFATMMRFAFLSIGCMLLWSLYKGGVWTTGMLPQILFIVALSAWFGALCLDVTRKTLMAGLPLVSYLATITAVARDGLREVRNVRSQHVQPIENYAPMGGGMKSWYAFMFLLLILVHAMVIYASALVPGAELAKELMQ